MLLDTGPEWWPARPGWAPATAQKIALNMISTLIGLQLGHVHDGYMVNLVADNAKLRDRAARIVADVAGADAAAAARGAGGDRRRGQARGAARRRRAPTAAMPTGCSRPAAGISARRSPRSGPGTRPGPEAAPRNREKIACN